MLLTMIMDGGIWDYFEAKLGRGYDREKFRYSVEPDDLEVICGECGEASCHCHTPQNCPYFPEDCAVCDRIADQLMEAREEWEEMKRGIDL